MEAGSTGRSRWADALLCGPHQDPAAATRAYDIAEQAGLIDSMRLPPLEGGSSAIIALGHVAHGVQAGQHLHDMDAMTGATSWGMLAAHAIAALLGGRGSPAASARRSRS
ncbi:hypothetical protein [Streptomyces atroolivaceus]|uniref:hypothetical protein n=1 Tax=Streptomyces atroolivaceus TaxID=66869 RepID=UPI00363AA0B3